MSFEEQYFGEANTTVAIVSTALFAVTCVSTLVMVLVIWRKFRVFTRHKYYLIFFSWTMLGFILMFANRVIWGWNEVVSQNIYFWIIYLLGQNLITSPETIRAIRITVLYYGYPSIYPPTWRNATHVKPKYLSTKYITFYLGLMQIPVFVMYIFLGVTGNLIFEYITLGYFGLQVLVLLGCVFALGRKKKEMKAHQVSETNAVLVFGIGLFLFIIFDNIRFFYLESRYSADTRLWMILDLTAFTLLLLLAWVIWIKHYKIMVKRDFPIIIKSKTCISHIGSNSRPDIRGSDEVQSADRNYNSLELEEKTFNVNMMHKSVVVSSDGRYTQPQNEKKMHEAM